MDNWFTVDRIDRRTFAISEWGHWEEVHAYLLIGSDRAALVDSGLGVGSIKRVVDELTERPTIVLTTHAHWDHIGGHGPFATIAVHPADAAWLRFGLPVSDEQIRQTLMAEPFRQRTPAEFDPDHWHPFRGDPTEAIVDGQTIGLGGRELTVLHTPGHSPGHVCFHEAATGYLITGDLVYRGQLDAYYPSTDPVAFAQSVKRTERASTITQISASSSSGGLSKFPDEGADPPFNLVADFSDLG